jgi:hypothetical protein
MSFKKYIIIISVIILAAGCKTPEPIIIRDVHYERVTETLRDTFVDIKSDTASIKALLKCDSLGNVYLEHISELKLGNKVKPEIQIIDNIITFDCIVDSIAVYFVWKERFTEKSDTTVIQEPVKKQGFLKSIQKFTKQLFWLVVILIIVGLTIRFANPLKGVLKWLKKLLKI